MLPYAPKTMTDFGSKRFDGTGTEGKKLPRKSRAKNCKDNKSILKAIPLTCRECKVYKGACCSPHSTVRAAFPAPRGMRSHLTPYPARMRGANSRYLGRRGYANISWQARQHWQQVSRGRQLQSTGYSQQAGVLRKGGQGVLQASS